MFGMNKLREDIGAMFNAHGKRFLDLVTFAHYKAATAETIRKLEARMAQLEAARTENEVFDWSTILGDFPDEPVRDEEIFCAPKKPAKSPRKKPAAKKTSRKR